MLESLQGVTSTVVRVALDGLAQQQRVLANNIANANSAGFSARRLDFESALRDVVKGDRYAAPETAKAHLRQVGQAIAAGDFIRETDNATVQLDIELAQMNETVLKFQALLEGLSKSGSLVQMAISGDGSK
jgi:flagellar basal-body rod protein FlgB